MLSPPQLCLQKLLVGTIKPGTHKITPGMLARFHVVRCGVHMIHFMYSFHWLTSTVFSKLVLRIYGLKVVFPGTCLQRIPEA